MGRNIDLSAVGKAIINLGDSKSTLEIAKMTGRDHRAMKMHVVRKRTDLFPNIVLAY